MNIAPRTEWWRHYAPLAALSTLLLAACRDSGLPGRNTPETEAAMRQSRYPVYDAGAAEGLPAAAGFMLAGQRWMRGATTEPIPDRLLKPVGNAQGAEVFALTWDQAPYSRLYLRMADGRHVELVRG